MTDLVPSEFPDTPGCEEKEFYQDIHRVFDDYYGSAPSSTVVDVLWNDYDYSEIYPGEKEEFIATVFGALHMLQLQRGEFRRYRGSDGGWRWEREPQ
ncbi:MAG: hypothetical protein ABEI97_01860 [Candidatus Nanohaloarchaea archaeon]